MKFVIVLLLILCYNISNAQIISTIAGNGISMNTGDGNLAIYAAINYPCGLVFDKKGNLYVTTGIYGHTIRKIDATGVITTIAGTDGVSGFSGDGGQASLAIFRNPLFLAIDTSDNLYISDAGNDRIRKIDMTTGIISTYAGNGYQGYIGDGIAATNTGLYDPLGICFDSKNNLYIADYMNYRIRKVNNLGIISTFVGNGIGGYNGDNGLADTSEIRAAQSICMDKHDNLFIADEVNGRIRKVDTFGYIHTIAGVGIDEYTGDGGLAINADISASVIAIDKFENIYLLDPARYKVRRIEFATGIITGFAGNGIFGYSGDGGPADSAEFGGNGIIILDSCGNLYISDIESRRIRKITYPHCNYLETENLEKEANGLSIYPNPAFDVLNIKSNKVIEEIVITNIEGKTLIKQVANNNQTEINIKNLPLGFYNVIVNNKMHSKFIKQ